MALGKASVFEITVSIMCDVKEDGKRVVIIIMIVIMIIILVGYYYNY